MVTGSDELRAELEPLTDFELITACAAFGETLELTDPDVAMRHVLGSLARRWLDLHAEIKIHTRHLKQRTQTVAPRLVETFGIGLDSAAELLLAAGDNTGRIRSEAAFAKMCGVCPIPSLVGQDLRTSPARPRRQPAGNAALYRIVIVRMRWHEPTKTYVERRTAEGLSKKDIIRCLKRYVAREVYDLLPTVDVVPEPLRAAA